VLRVDDDIRDLIIRRESIRAIRTAAIEKGTRLLRQAERIAAQHGYRRLAVISAVGTRRYYLRRGFERGELYLSKEVIATPVE